jgi:hypothetical protein
MDYQKHYNLLIDRARGRTLSGYGEWHHILPKCMGGSDNKDNLVFLTPEEHFVAHQLLIKVYPTHIGLARAAYMLTVNKPGQNRNNNKLYGWIKRKLSSEKRSREHCKNLSVACLGKKKPEGFGLSVSTRMRGKKASEETKKKLKLRKPTMLGKTHNLEARKKISDARSKQVLCVELNRKFHNCVEATIFIGLKNPSSIRDAARGKNKSAGGYTWKYC